MRRRLSAFIALLVGLGGIAALNASAGSSLPELARQHIELTKLCTASASGGPVFEITNVTDQSFGGPAQPESITVTIKDRYAPKVTPGSPGVVSGTVSIDGGLAVPATQIVIPAGSTAVFTPEAGWPWTSAFTPDRQYFAHFTATVNGKAKVMRTHEFCDCTVPGTTVAGPGETTTTIHVP